MCTQLSLYGPGHQDALLDGLPACGYCRAGMSAKNSHDKMLATCEVAGFAVGIGQ